MNQLNAEDRRRIIRKQLEHLDSEREAIQGAAEAFEDLRDDRFTHFLNEDGEAKTQAVYDYLTMADGARLLRDLLPQ